MIKTIAICILAAQIITVNEYCNKGCLRCDEAVCTLCDVFRSYKKKDDGCELDVIDHCLHVDNDGVCWYCDTDYYVKDNACVAVPADKEKSTTNCILYSSTLSCVACDSKYYLKDGECTSTTAIANCVIYAGEKTCGSCDEFYDLNKESTKCESFKDDEVDHCFGYTPYRCESCSSGYVVNPNVYIANMKDLDANSLLSILDDFVGNDAEIIDGPSHCQKTDVDYCFEFLDYDTCVTCNTGYFKLEDDTCKKNPDPIVDYCSLYSDLETCIECKSGYLKISSTECKAIETPLDNCETHDATKSTKICTKCKDKYFLSGASCQDRVKSLEITNCATKDLDKDVCELCDSGFLLSDDETKCLAAHSNCILGTGNAIDDTTKKVNCKTCAQNYELVDATKSCSKVDVGDSNCSVFETNKSDCNTCVFDYYLKNNACVKNDWVVETNCVTTHRTNQNTCTECKPGMYHFTVEHVCVAQTEIPNCKTYSADKSDCSACDDGYILKNDECDATTITNCKTGTDTDNCTKCMDGYYVYEDKDDEFSCKAAADYISDNCEANETEETGTYYLRETLCEKCNDFGVPYTTEDNYICVDEDLFFTDHKEFDAEKVTNCKQYNQNGPGGFKCLYCKEDYYLTDGGECEACSGFTDDIVLFNDNSEEELISHCTTKEENTQGIEYKHISGEEYVDCGTGKYLQLDDLYTASNLFSYININEFEIMSPLYKQILGNCGTIGAPVTDCEVYDTTPTCMRCSTGKVLGINNAGAVTCVTQNNKCGNNYLNFPDEFQVFLSCSSCDTGYTPIIKLIDASAEANANKYIRYNIEGDQGVEADNATYTPIITCMQDNFNFKDGESANISIANDEVDNCALYVLSTAYNANYAEDDLSCKACMPGYKDDEGDCAAIDNCDKTGTNTWIDACQTPNNNFVYKFANNKVNYDDLVDMSDNELFYKNCYAAADDSACSICDKGYVLKSGGYCDKLTMSNCSDNVF